MTNAHNKEIADSLSSLSIQWQFNPRAAPHFGSQWEAGVKSFKYQLQRILETTVLHFQEMTTIVTQIGAYLNSRPISEISADPNDLEALTPGHFLTGD